MRSIAKHCEGDEVLHLDVKVCVDTLCSGAKRNHHTQHSSEGWALKRGDSTKSEDPCHSKLSCYLYAEAYLTSGMPPPHHNFYKLKKVPPEKAPPNNSSCPIQRRFP